MLQLNIDYKSDYFVERSKDFPRLCFIYDSCRMKTCPQLILKHEFLDLDSIHRGNVNLLDSPYLSTLAR